MKSKCVVFLVLLFAMVHPTAAVPGIVDPVDAGADMVADGIESSVMRFADEMFNFGNETMGMVDEYGYVRVGIFNFATYYFDPFEVQVVKEYNKITALIGLIIAIVYILLGGAMTQLLQLYPIPITFIFGEETQNFTIKNYVSNLVLLIGISAFIYLFVRIVLTLNYVLTELAMVGILDSITPSPDNIVMYCMMGVCYMMMSIFFAIRLIYIIFFAAFCFPIGILLVPKISRPYALSAFLYFIRITFMQLIVVSVTSVGVMFIDGMGLMGSLPFTAPSLYLALIILLVLIGVYFTIGFGVVKRGAYIARRLAL